MRMWDMNKTNAIKTLLLNYLSQNDGVNAVIFALVMPALVAAGGLALDLAEAYNVRNKLGQALDKAAIAAAASTGSEEELRTIASNFLKANFREDGFGDLLESDVIFGEKTVTVTATAKTDTNLMRLFGKDFLNISASSTVIRQLSGVEVAMVLDVTGSMAGSNLEALKDASNLFIGKMFEEISDPSLIKIGIVPYSASVNVGPYGLGTLSDGSYYASGFVDRPENDMYYSDTNDIEYDTGVTNQWHGCVLAESYPDDTLDDTSYGFGMYRYPRRCTASWYGYCFSYSGNANSYCPATPVVPLTNNRASLEDTIDDLSASGSTYGNIGMIWGWRLLSPEAPFTEGVDYDDPRWDKVVIMMTDGDNTMDGWYSAYGSTSSHGLNAYDLDDRLSETCENMKDEEITVYTITFESGVDDETKDIYRNCATTGSMYSHAPDNTKLSEIFEDIANQLSRLHITQ